MPTKQLHDTKDRQRNATTDTGMQRCSGTEYRNRH